MNKYRGRFAPSPTGPLHFGSLFAAVISYLDAKTHAGYWLVRIEDIDPLREKADSKKSILDTLEAHGLCSDEDVIYQSQQSSAYETVLSRLADKGYTFHCPCSRKQLDRNLGKHTQACTDQRFTNETLAIKFKANQQRYSWQDGLQGIQSEHLTDDFVLRRKESFYAYQLAVVCDDITQNISHVVRGHDLLSSTPMQLALYEALEAAPPSFSHFPIISSEGQKLSKQNFAEPVDPKLALFNLSEVFRLIGLTLPAKPSNIGQALDMATMVWETHLLSKKREIIMIKS